MKIALAQRNYRVGDIEGNTSIILDAISQAEKSGAALIVFAELSLCGYPPLDLLNYPSFIEQCDKSLKIIAEACSNIGCILGVPIKNPVTNGKPLLNTAVFCFKGKTEFFAKTSLPDYDVFNETRYFDSSSEVKLLNFNGMKIALPICEDIWGVENKTLYKLNPMEELMKLKPDLILTIAASPFNYEQPEQRLKVLQDNVKKYQLPLLYVNHVGAQTGLIFDGGTTAIAANGNVTAVAPLFEEAILTIDTETLFQPGTAPVPFHFPEKIKLIQDGLILGIRDYFAKSGFRHAVLGLSGGLDSAVVAALSAMAIGPENIIGVLMPSQFSSGQSITDAQKLASNIGIKTEILSIEDLFEIVASKLNPLFKGKSFDLTEENIQARIRGLLLMAISNKFNYLLLNSSNKSESAVGYGTLYGDMAGGLAVIGDLYKTEVFQLATYLNREKEIIPLTIISKPPSAELRPNQKDSDNLPPYSLLDEILYQHVEHFKGAGELKEAGFDPQLVDRILRMVSMNEHKRFQAPPVLRVSPKAFGTGRMMPLLQRFF